MALERRNHDYGLVIFSRQRTIAELHATRGCAGSSADRKRATGHGAQRLQQIVRTVAERSVVGLFAAAKVHGASRLCNEPQWLKARRLMRTVAERLLLRTPARAEEVGFSFLNLDLVRSRLSGDRFVGHPLRPSRRIGGLINAPRSGVARGAPAHRRGDDGINRISAGVCRDQ